MKMACEQKSGKTVKIANDPWAILIPQMAGGQLEKRRLTGHRTSVRRGLGCYIYRDGGLEGYEERNDDCQKRSRAH